ncbi:hypothetical protein [Streptomyces sp. NPDC101234]
MRRGGPQPGGAPESVRRFSVPGLGRQHPVAAGDLLSLHRLLETGYTTG